MQATSPSQFTPQPLLTRKAQNLPPPLHRQHPYIAGSFHTRDNSYIINISPTFVY
uniref:Uncharacterized protein n=1 Tax=Bartonella schoenbuchensis (strain DSM 13525 / NCTC 13165 / R1) TaxID=687861 RepID=E6Z1B6_BARSR|nr:hypothetical protein BARSC_190177 [Bartonella schoenbuchensis R1]